MVTIWFRYNGWVNPNSWNLQYDGGEFATLETHQDITLYELKMEAKRLTGFPYCAILWWYNGEMFEVTEHTRWNLIKNYSGELVQLIIVKGHEKDDEEYSHLPWSGYDPVRHMLGLGLCGGNPEDGECSNAGVPVAAAEADEAGGAGGDSDDGMSSVASSVDVEAEDEDALHEARTNLQGLDAYDEDWISGDWEEGLDCNDWASHSSSSSNVCDFKLGESFDDKKGLQAHVKKWHIKNARQCKSDKSDKTRIRFKCIDDSCSWFLRGMHCPLIGDWTITKLGPPHTCHNSEPITQHRQLDCQLISDVIYQSVNRNKGITIGDLQVFIQKEYQIEPTYRKVWYAKSMVIERIYGTHEEAFEKFPLVMVAQQFYNPGTVFEYAWKGFDVEKGSQVFDKWFWAYGPSIAGFPHCRPVISIDGTHLYGKYKGKLLIAVAYDAGNHIFPLAFALCANESTETWTWFLKHLRKHVTKDTRELCIISDRHKGILRAVEEVWRDGGVVHRYCARHLASNFNTHFKNIKLKKKFEKMVWTSSKVMFQDALQRWKTANDGQYKQFIEQLGDFSHWSFAHDGGSRYGSMTTNHSEAFNNVLMKVRTLPVTGLLKVTFSRMTKWWVNRALEGARELEKGTIFLPKIAEKLKEADEASGQMRCTPYRYGVKYNVETYNGDTFVVNLEEKNCECGKFQLFHMPCSHAMCVIKKVGVRVEPYVDPHLKIDRYIRTYAVSFEPIYRTGTGPVWDGPSVTFDPDMLVSGKGRKKGRIPNEMDTSRQSKKKVCSKCHLPGHNKRTCRTTT